MKKNRIYDTAKFLTVFLVVLAHVTRMYTGHGLITPVETSQLLAKLTEYIYSFHMPLFILLSGCVFGYCIEKGKYQDKAKFLKNKCLRLLLPYACFGFFYVAPVMVGFRFTDMGYLEYDKYGILLSHNARHLWYILALFWIFMMAIWCRKVLLSNKYVLLLFMGASLILYFLSTKVPDVFQLRAAASYQFYFFLGVCVNRYIGKVWDILKQYGWASVGLLILLLGQFWKNNTYLSICYACMGIVFVLIFCVWAENFDFSENAFVKKINRNGYGIYFFHPMIIYVLFHFTFNRHIHPVLLCALIFLIAFVSSYYLTELTRKLKLGWVMGE